MKPDDPNQSRRVGTPLIPQRSLLQTQTPPARDNHRPVFDAAANIARSQLDSIYDGNTHTPTPQTTPVHHEQIQQQSIETASPYERTHAPQHAIQAEQWKQYHSAWQDYYKQYYERYYVGEVYKARQALESHVKTTAPTQPQAVFSRPTPEPEPTTNNESVSRGEAMYDLRQKLLGNIQDSAKKVRKSRHFIPITAAACVMVLFLFLQYNRVLFANVNAYISPGNIDPANIIVDPTTTVAVSNEPKLIIPKINVDVPVIYNTTPDYDSQMAAMAKGVAWFGIPGANSHPGQVGNTVLSGHSSNDVLDKGDYKFIFAQLDHLQKGDLIYVNYKGTRYTYNVTKKEVVKPTDVEALIYETDKPVLTLITCTPLGTSLNRLLVTAEQISPNPSGAKKAPTKPENSEPAKMPGNSPTFIERIFGG